MLFRVSSFSVFQIYYTITINNFIVIAKWGEEQVTLAAPFTLALLNPRPVYFIEMNRIRTVKLYWNMSRRDPSC